MEEETNNRRLLIAAGLCLVVLLGYNLIFPTPRAKPVAAASDAGVATSTRAETPPQIAVTSTRAVEVPEVEAKPATFTFKGEVPAVGDGNGIPFEVRLTNVGGGIDHFELPSYKERDRDNRKTDQPITLARPVPPDGEPTDAMAGLTFLEGTTFAMPKLPVYEVLEQHDDWIRYRYVSKNGVEIEREYRLNKDDLQIELAVTVRNRSNTPQTHHMALASALPISEAMMAGNGFFSAFIPPPDHLTGLCHTDGKVQRVNVVKLQKDGAQSFTESVRWVAMDRQYFVAALVPRDGTPVECALSSGPHVARAELKIPSVTLQPGEERRHKFTAYLGVKKPALMTRVNAELERAMDYTILGMDLRVVCEALLWLLGILHGWFNSWGLAILGLTIIVKVVLFPLNQKSGKSMRKMSALKPQIDSIREKFPEDRARQSEEMMRLYKEHGVNPAGGCLPTLIQMPIWFALYRSLWVSTDLYQQSFLWISDLTARDGLFFGLIGPLPILLILAMFIQQRMTPAAMDPAQQKIMQYTMPLVFGLMMMALPAGLCFYILVNTLLTILQTHFINRSIRPIGGSASAQGASAESPTGH